ESELPAPLGRRARRDPDAPVVRCGAEPERVGPTLGHDSLRRPFGDEERRASVVPVAVPALDDARAAVLRELLPRKETREDLHEPVESRGLVEPVQEIERALDGVGVGIGAVPREVALLVDAAERLPDGRLVLRVARRASERSDTGERVAP